MFTFGANIDLCSHKTGFKLGMKVAIDCKLYSWRLQMKLLRTLTFSSIIVGCITGCGSDSDNELADLSGSKQFTLEEATIADLQDAFKYKRYI